MESQLTQMLQRWRGGDSGAENAVAEAIYPLLRAIARRQLQQPDGMTVQPTELANEAFIKLREQREVDWQNRSQFYAIAGRVVRRVVIDHLRERNAQKRGKQAEHLSLDELTSAQTPTGESTVDWLMLDQVLDDLEAFDSEGARLIEMRVFSGLTVDEIAEIRGVSASTVTREWRALRAWVDARLAA